MTHDKLLTDLRAATEGSAELSVRALRVIQPEHDWRIGGREGPTCGRMQLSVNKELRWYEAPCITTDLSAAWRVAMERGHEFTIDQYKDHAMCALDSGPQGKKTYSAVAATPALALTAAIVAAAGG